MRATLDLIGLYNYDNTLLDEFVIPEAVDRETLVNNLLMESAELELIYADALFLKMAIGFWSKKQLHIWEEQYATTQYDYNPIWNKDGEFIETRDLKLKEDTKDNLDRVDNLTDKNTRDYRDKETRDLQDENVNSVYGFNTDNDAPAGKDVAKGTGTDTMEHTGTDTMDHTGRQDLDRTIDSTKLDTGTINRVERGNIGVTSTQSLIAEQRAVVQYNIYDIIIHDFIDRFCLKLY